MTIRSVLLAALALLPFLVADALNASPSCDAAASSSRLPVAMVWLPANTLALQRSQADGPVVGAALSTPSPGDWGGPTAEPYEPKPGANAPRTAGVVTAEFLVPGVDGLGRQTVF